MHKLMVNEIVSVCKKRHADGDRATVSPFSAEQMEDAILELSGSVKTFAEEIEASHPCRLKNDAAYRADALAMKLVGERHEKRELVDLVRWMILDRAETANRAV